MKTFLQDRFLFAAAYPARPFAHVERYWELDVSEDILQEVMADNVIRLLGLDETWSLSADSRQLWCDVSTGRCWRA